jgi:glycosyltransferase involved in cell wall biosynthesis
MQPDIAHIQYQTGAFGMQPMINFLPRFIPPPDEKNGVGVVVTFHDLLPAYLFPKAGPLRDWVTFQLARGADAVIATNEPDYLRLREKVRGEGKWLELIPIGSNITPSEIPPEITREKLRERLGVRADETLLVYFGFLNPSKGAETLIQALYDLPQTKLLFLGGQTGATDPTNVEYREHVKQEIRDRRLENRVLWTDFLPPDAVSAHFYAADVCVLPYRDGASFRRGSIMAALAHGMPIVTTFPQTAPQPELRTRDEKMDYARIPKLPILRDADNVLLVPPDDAQAIILAVTRIQTSPGLAAQLRSRARETARAFSWDKIADDHLALYDKIVR